MSDKYSVSRQSPGDSGESHTEDVPGTRPAGYDNADVFGHEEGHDVSLVPIPRAQHDTSPHQAENRPDEVLSDLKKKS